MNALTITDLLLARHMKQEPAKLAALFGDRVSQIDAQEDSVHFCISTETDLICWQGIGLELVEIDARNKRLYCYVKYTSLDADLRFAQAMIEVANDYRKATNP